MASASQIEIGSKAQIDLERIQDRIPTDLFKRLKDAPHGIVLEYKITDGKGIGFVLQLNDGSTSWFFDDEIKKTTTKAESTNKQTFMVVKKTRPYQSGHGETPIELLNPINFMKWLNYSLKDVF